MPATISVGLSRKVGEANYGSRGGSVSVELEIDTATLTDPAAFRARVQTLYSMARSSLEEELARTDDGADPTAVPSMPSQSAGARSGATAGNFPTHTPASPSDASTGAVGAAGAHRATNDKPATQSQVRAIFAIGKRRQLDPRDLVQQRFGLNSVDQLSIREASRLIDELNAPVGASQ
jgi:hypothetical protein